MSANVDKDEDEDDGSGGGWCVGETMDVRMRFFVFLIPWQSQTGMIASKEAMGRSYWRWAQAMRAHEAMITKHAYIDG